MKRITLLLIAIATLVGCKKDEEFTISHESLSLSRNEAVQLNASMTAEYKSLDTNIAHVSASGLITGNRIGSTDVIATAGGKTLYCRVTVSPRSTLYREPLFQVASSRADIKNYETRQLEFENAQSLIYSGENNNVDGVIYLVGISYDGADVLLTGFSAYSEAFDFLDERYPPIGEIYEDAFAYEVDQNRFIVANYDADLGYNVMYLFTDKKTGVTEAFRKAMKR